MNLPHPVNRPAPTSAVTWRHWAILVIAGLALLLVVLQLIVGFSPAGRAAFLGLAVADLVLAISLLHPSSGA